jgi:hypothetical protein
MAGWVVKLSWWGKSAERRTPSKYSGLFRTRVMLRQVLRHLSVETLRDRITLSLHQGPHFARFLAAVDADAIPEVTGACSMPVIGAHRDVRPSSPRTR